MHARTLKNYILHNDGSNKQKIKFNEYMRTSRSTQVPMSIAYTIMKGGAETKPSAAFTNTEFPLKKGQKLVIVGDVHGDIGALKSCLLHCAKVVNQEYDWNFGCDTIVVIAGDTIDRRRSNSITNNEGQTPGEIENEELILRRLLVKLSNQAVVSGGMLITLMGNHEGGYLKPKLRSAQMWAEKYTTKYVLEKEKGARKRAQTWRWGGEGFQTFTQCGNHRIFVKIGNFIIVHGGFTRAFIKAFNGYGAKSLTEINTIMHKWIHTKKASKEEQNIITLLFRNGGPLWDKAMAGRKEFNEEHMCGHDGLQDGELHEIFKAMGYATKTTRICVAHCTTPSMALTGKLFPQTLFIPKLQQDNKQLTHAEVFGPVYNSTSARCTYGDQKEPLNIKECPYVSGIHWQCNGQIWRVDVSMSRAFDSINAYYFLLFANVLSKEITEKRIKDYWKARRPQVLSITGGGVDAGDRVDVIRSRYDLPRDVDEVVAYCNKRQKSAEPIQKEAQGTTTLYDYNGRINGKPGYVDIRAIITYVLGFIVTEASAAEPRSPTAAKPRSPITAEPRLPPQRTIKTRIGYNIKKRREEIAAKKYAKRKKSSRASASNALDLAIGAFKT